MKLWINFLVIPLWHFFVLLVIEKIDYKYFYIECNQVDINFFRKREKFYENVLRIKAWKDLVPQYISKSGFSKKNMVSLKLDYIKRFISETYRAEFDHVFCCFIIPFIFLFNTFKASVIFSTIVCISNIPFVLIQRYNRLRLRQLLLKMKRSSLKKVSEV